MRVPNPLREKERYDNFDFAVRADGDPADGIEPVHDMNEKLTLNYVYAGLCLIGAVYFIFKG